MCEPGVPSFSDDGELLTETAEPGIYLRSGRFQAVCDFLRRGFFQLRTNGVGPRFVSPGFIPRGDLARSSYTDKFPQFVSRVTAEQGQDRGELITLPSACLSIYSQIAPRHDPLTADGLLATVCAACFRNEAGYGPERMRAFTMAEYVIFGDEAQTAAFREDMSARLHDWLERLGLMQREAPASDPFFGRIGELMAERQRAANLKREVLLPISADREIAAFSINDHKDFFCSRWDIRLPDGATAQSSCVGVGLERLTLAMFHRHGPTFDAWPAALAAAVTAR